MPHTNEEMMKRFDERYKRKMLGETLGYDIAHQKDLKHFINQEISDLKKSIREEIAKEKEHWEKHSAGNYKFGATEALNKILSIKPLE